MSRFSLQIDALDSEIEESMEGKMPPLKEQEILLELYFTYVHPILPVVHRTSFMEAYKLR